MSSKKVLGRGLRALIPVSEESVPVGTHAPFRLDPSGAPPAGPPVELPVDRLTTNPDQPRRQFDESALARLADSIRQHGMLQPILVRPVGDGYQIVAGERRFLAARRAGLAAIPVQVREIQDDALLETALVENIQRQDLSPLEEAEAYRKLTREMRLSQEQVALHVGRDRTSITNSLRLLDLPGAVKTLLEQGKLTAGHARAILALRHPEDMTLLAHEVVDKALSVRQTESKAREALGVSTAGRSARRKAKGGSPDGPNSVETSRSAQLVTNDAALPPAVRALREQLTTRLATRVQLHRAATGGHGTLTIDFYSDDDLDRVASIILGSH